MQSLHSQPFYTRLPDRKDRYIFCPFIILAATTSIFLPNIFFGIDLTDTGYNIYKSWIMSHKPEMAMWFLTWFSTYLSGITAKLFNVQSVFGFRLLWVALNGLTAITAYFVLIRFYQCREVILPVIIGSLVSIAGSDQLLPSYYTIPPFLVLLSICAFIFTIDTRNIILGFAGGIICGILIFGAINSRIPILPFYFTLLLPILYIKGGSPSASQYLRLKYAAIILGIFLAGTALFFLLKEKGLLHTFVDDISGFTKRSLISEQARFHHAGSVIGVTVIRLLVIIAEGGLFLIFLLSYAGTKYIRDKYKDLILFLVACVTSSVAVVLLKPGFVLSAIIGMPLLLLCYNYVVNGSVLSSEKKIIYAVSIAFLLFMSFGSAGVSLNTVRYGVWLVMPVALIESTYMTATAKYIRKTIILFAVIFTIVVRIQMPYRDKPVYRLDTAFHTQSIGNIYSSKNRVAVLEELLVEIEKLQLEKYATAVCYTNIPLMYFLTRTVTPFKNPWLNIDSVDTAYIERKLDALEKNDDLPDIVIRAKNASVRNPYWPDNVAHDEPFMFSSDGGKEGLLDEFFQRHKYGVIWENELFAVLSPDERP